MSLSIYEILEAYVNLREILEDPDISDGDKQAAMDNIEDAFDVKVENYGMLIREIEAQTAGLDAEIKRMQELKARNESTINRLKGNLFHALRTFGKDKFKTDKFQFSIRKNPASVALSIEPEQLPEQYRTTKVTVSADKKALKEALNNGEVIEGVSLVRSERLDIK